MTLLSKKSFFKFHTSSRNVEFEESQCSLLCGKALWNGHYIKNIDDK